MQHPVDHPNPKDIQKAGTGFMLMPSEAMEELEKKGYTKNLTLKVDHFEVDSGHEKIYPDEFEIDDFVRFENASDPDDQSILYAISSARHNLKGLFLESYGLYTEETSRSMIEKFRNHLNRDTAGNKATGGQVKR
jgi:hypothetical protein